jgi:transposase
MMSVLRTGCAWRHRPHDLTVGCSAAHKHVLRRSRARATVLPAIPGQVGTRSGRRRPPTAAAVDSSSLKASPAAGPRGFHGATTVDGVKRDVLLDSAGFLAAAAGTPGQRAGRRPSRTCSTSNRLAPTITGVWLDEGYTPAPPLPMPPPTPQSPPTSRPGPNPDVDSSSSHDVQPRRWVLERTTGWINHRRRLHRQYEVTLTAHQEFLIFSQVALLPTRLDRSQLFDAH